MFDWLIVMLGGTTKRELAVHTAVCDGWRDRCLAAETTVTLFKDIVERERERSDKIETDIRNRMHPENGMQGPPGMKPVGHALSSWPRIRRELEKSHRVNDNAEVSREEIEKTIRQG